MKNKLLLYLFVALYLTACGQSSETKTEKTPHQVVSEFVDAKTRHKYDEMFSLISPKERSEHKLEDLVSYMQDNDIFIDPLMTIGEWQEPWKELGDMMDHHTTYQILDTQTDEKNAEVKVEISFVDWTMVLTETLGIMIIEATKQLGDDFNDGNLDLAEMITSRFSKQTPPTRTIYEKIQLSKVDGNWYIQLGLSEKILTRNRLLLKKNQDELKKIMSRFQNLKDKQKQHQFGQKVISKLTIKDSDFYWKEGDWFETPVIDFWLKNDSEIPIKSVYYHGVVQSPNRTVPWISENFNHSITGGLESGEETHILLEPNKFSAWGDPSARNRNDASLEIQVLNAADSEDQELLIKFDNDDAERLDYIEGKKLKLEKKISYLKKNTQ
ncbi:MAG: hypothetical protein ACI9YB_003118 [Halioglobus sp.]|jgi:hypothetical protein